MSSVPEIAPRPQQQPELRFSHLADWLAWQESLHFTAIELGLDRCNKVAGRMGLLKSNSKVISISGTNGKGSSAAMLDAMLRQSGYKVGAYTSPHLTGYNERICINGKQVTDDQLCRSFHRIDQARGDISLTYFRIRHPGCPGHIPAFRLGHHYSGSRAGRSIGCCQYPGC